MDKDFRDAYFEKRSIDVVHNKTTPKINITRTEYQDFNAMLPSPTSGPQKQDFEALVARLPSLSLQARHRRQGGGPGFSSD